MTGLGTLRALVCPLDWGLGHAARCVPVIRTLLEKGCEVALAADGLQASLVQKEFPDLTVFPLRGYRIRYSSRLPLAAGLVLQSPLYACRYLKARQHFLHIVQHYKPTVIISDNRPECFWGKAFSVYLTHQLSLSLYGLKLLENVFSLIHAKAASRFQEVWIPDVPEYPGLSGKLGHPSRNYFRQPVVYVGILSRFQPLSKKNHPVYDICFTHSGPEPARSRWEMKIIEQGRAYPEKKFALIRGTTQPLAVKLPDNFFCLDQASSAEIQNLWAQSRRLVCRAGYSTLMDLSAAGRSAWIVPTPGQTEQEYLADLHRNSERFHPVREKDFSMDAVLKQEFYETHGYPVKNELLPKAVEALIEKVKTHKQH